MACAKKPIVVCVQIAEPVNACSFAAGLSSQETGVGGGFGAFHGQMGCIYLFEDVLNPGKSTTKSLHTMADPKALQQHHAVLGLVRITLHKTFGTYW